MCLLHFFAPLTILFRFKFVKAFFHSIFLRIVVSHSILSLSLYLFLFDFDSIRCNTSGNIGLQKSLNRLLIRNFLLCMKITSRQSDLTKEYNNQIILSQFLSFTRVFLSFFSSFYFPIAQLRTSFPSSHFSIFFFLFRFLWHSQQYRNSIAFHIESSTRTQK